MKRDSGKKLSIQSKNEEAVFEHLTVKNRETADDTTVQRTIREIGQDLFGVPPEQLELGDEYVKNSLQEILLSLILISEQDIHGKALMEQLSNSLNTSVSPGTMYPELHRLHEKGVLEQHELVQTKVYDIGDSQAAREQLIRSAQAHFIIGQIHYRALEQLNG
jgi:DNA-binding PadR family transcriptional regulator